MERNISTIRESQTERLERFVALDAGQFWKALVDEHEKQLIGLGDVLLITNIDYVDDQAHTITVRIHPSKQRNGQSRHAKFRVKDFLRDFEHVEEEIAKEEREARLDEIQGRINDAQIELTQASTDMNVLDAFVQRDLPDEERSAQLPVVREALPSNVVGAIKTQKVSSLMTKGLTDAGVQQIKSAMQHQVGVIEKRSGWLTKKTGQLAAIANEMTPYFEEQAALALAETSEMRKHIDKLMKGISSLNLYTLKDVEVFNIKEGTSAPSDIKLTIAQSVLYMDEEMAVYAPVSSSFDSRDQNTFFDALREHPALVNQIFPTERCIVGVATTRHYRDYSGYHAITAAKLMEANAVVFFLVRDGENLYGVVSSEVMHQFTPRLFPSWDELKKPFRGVRGEDITYDSIQYTNSLSDFEKMSLAYKRMLILLCGLDHQKQLFGQFYPEAASLDFVTQSFQEKYINFIYDDDGSNMFKGSSSEKPTINEWLHDMNATITAGSRVLLKWRDCFSTDSIPAAYERESTWHSYDYQRSLLFTPDNASKAGFIEAVVEMQNGKMFVTLPLSGNNNRYQHRELNARLSLDEAFACIENEFSIICLDRVNPDDLKFYLHNRSARTLNVPAIKAVKQALGIAERDYVQEQPIRARLYHALEAGGVAHGTDSLKLISEAVATFRCANKGAKLNIVENDDKKYHQLLDQMFMLSGKSGDFTESVIEAEKSVGRSVIRISLDNKGVYVAYSTPLAKERDDRLVDFVWVARTRYKPTAKSIKPQKTTFAKLHSRPANETIKYEIENYEDYVFPQSHPWKTPNAKAKQLEYAMQPKAIWDALTKARTSDTEFDKFVSDYINVRRAASDSHVEEPCIVVPVAVAMLKSGQIGAIGLGMDSVDALIYLASGDEDRLSRARRAHISLYNREDIAGGRFDRALERNRSKTFVELCEPLFIAGQNAFDSGTLWVKNHNRYRIGRYETQAYSIQAVLEHKMHNYVFMEGIESSADDFFGITQPKDYNPCVVKECDSFRGDWNGYILCELTDALLSEIKSNNVHVNHYFDTLGDAELYMSEKSVMSRNEDTDDFDEIFYVEVDNYPTDLKSRSGIAFPVIKGWALNRDGQ